MCISKIIFYVFLYFLCSAIIMYIGKKISYVERHWYDCADADDNEKWYKIIRFEYNHTRNDAIFIIAACFPIVIPFLICSLPFLGLGWLYNNIDD